MNNVLIEAKQCNGKWYRVVNVVDVIANDGFDSHLFGYDELEFVKVQMKVDLLLFSIWLDVKVYRVTEKESMIQQLAKATKLLNKILE